MNTRYIAIAVIVVILLGVGGFLFYNQSQNRPAPTETANSSPSTASNQQTIFDLFSSGANQECTFSYKNESSGESSGTFYITKDKLRGDVTTNAEGKATDFSMIRVGDDNYMWGSEFDGGIEMTLSLEELKGNEEASAYVDLDKNFDYKCKGWTVDNTKFTPPSNVKFTDFSAMMEASTKATTGGDFKMDASVCASITDPSTKAACEKAVEGQ